MKHLEVLNRSFADHTTQRVLTAKVFNELVDSWQAEIINVNLFLSLLLVMRV